MTTVAQKTFGAIVGLEPVVPVAPHRDDLVDCIDTGARIARADAVECGDGTYCEDYNNTGDCPDCGDRFALTVLEDHDGRCPTCRADYSECEDCRAIVHNTDCIRGPDGIIRCLDCDSAAWVTCASCMEAVFHADAIRRLGEYYCPACDGCVGDDDEREPDDWSGGNDCDETGSLRGFGVELEANYAPGWWTWIEDTAFGAKNDGTVRAGKEFVSPVLWGDDGLAEVSGFCAEAKRNGCTVSDACGYHLHLDMSDEDDESLRRIALAYCLTEAFWFACVDDSRQNNYYCQPTTYEGHTHWTADDIIAYGRPRPDCRYVWANWKAYTKHKTLEIRLHQGTFNGRAVCNWIKAHLRFVEAVRLMTVGQIVRTFGGKTLKAQMRNMRDIWRDDELADYYAKKAGIEGPAYAAN
jgi:hypothetical protein